jgi:hypothetical protein
MLLGGVLRQQVCQNCAKYAVPELLRCACQARISSAELLLRGGHVTLCFQEGKSTP